MQYLGLILASVVSADHNTKGKKYKLKWRGGKALTFLLLITWLFIAVYFVIIAWEKKNLSLLCASCNCSCGFREEIQASAFPWGWWTSPFKVGHFYLMALTIKSPISSLWYPEGQRLISFLIKKSGRSVIFPESNDIFRKFIWTKNEVSSPQTPISSKVVFWWKFLK